MATDNFAFVELVEGANNIPQHNENLSVIDIMLKGIIRDATSSAPPVSPADGDFYFVSGSGTGDWSGQSNVLAFRIGGAWIYRDCPDDYIVLIETAPSTNNRMYRKNGTGSLWTLLSL